MRLLFIGTFILISFSSWTQARRALNLIEKEKYEVGFDLLQNACTKDTLSADIPYVLATLYLNEQWERTNLDSAYFFVLLAIEKYNQLDEKQLDKHIKDGFDKPLLMILKKDIDKKVFNRTKTEGKAQDYQRFIDKHPNALELDSAVYLRNEQAFINASLTNTLKSYKFFLDKYPDALDWQEANDQYQRILYIESTTSGKLADYFEFINNYPKSPYYEQAVSEIYLIKAGENSTQTLLTFAEKYPQTKAAQKAIGVLYHRYIQHESANYFAEKYPQLNLSDSLIHVISTQYNSLIPIWDKDRIQLINLENKVVVDSIEMMESFLTDQDFFSVKKNGKQQLISKKGQVFYQGKWEFSIEDKNGFIFLKNFGKTEVVHKNGSYITAGEEAKLIGPFIGFKTNYKWGLKSITNKLIIEATYDSIWFTNGLIFIEEKGKTSANKPEQFYPALDGTPILLNPYYEDFEWFSDSLLWVATKDKEGLLNKRLEELVPLGKQRIDIIQNGWTITKKNKTLNANFSEIWLTNFKENNNWQIGIIEDSVLVKYNYQQRFSPTKASFLGTSAVEMEINDTTFIYITDTIRLLKTKNLVIAPLFDQSNNTAYYEVTENKRRKVLDYKGKEIILPTYIKLVPLNSHYLLAETANNKSLYNSLGVKLLEHIDGVALINDSTISILKNQQFGILIPNDSLFIKPQYDKELSPLFDSLWIAFSGTKYGVINSTNEEVLPFQYEEIYHWVNGLLFLKKDLKWSIYDIYSKRFMENSITQFTHILRNRTPMIKYQKGIGTGIFDSKNGIILKPTYSSIYLEGTFQEPYYRADKFVEEASLHIVLYYNMKGELLFQKILEENSFNLLYSIMDK